MKHNIEVKYGSFNLNMDPIHTIDVTNQVKKLIFDDLLSIPADFNFKELNKQLADNSPKYLQIINNQNVYNVAEDRYDYPVNINLAKNHKNLKIIYNVFLNPNANWRGIISGQLLQLKSYGILSEADLYIHLTDPFNIVDQAKLLINELYPLTNISYSSINQYEYPGIKLLKVLSQKYPEDNFIYFHTKGISYDAHSRTSEEINLFAHTFKNWRKNLMHFDDGIIQKIGLFPASMNGKNSFEIEFGGWIWYNYWYATGKYLADCPDPIITSERYYYEAWVGMRNQISQFRNNDCLNLYQINNLNKKYYTPEEADYFLNFLAKKPLKFTKRVLNIFLTPIVHYYYLFTEKNIRNLF